MITVVRRALLAAVRRLQGVSRELELSVFTRPDEALVLQVMGRTKHYLVASEVLCARQLEAGLESIFLEVHLLAEALQRLPGDRIVLWAEKDDTDDTRWLHLRSQGVSLRLPAASGSSASAFPLTPRAMTTAVYATRAQAILGPCRRSMAVVNRWPRLPLRLRDGLRMQMHMTQLQYTATDGHRIWYEAASSVLSQSLPTVEGITLPPQLVHFLGSLPTTLATVGVSLLLHQPTTNFALLKLHLQELGLTVLALCDLRYVDTSDVFSLEYPYSVRCTKKDLLRALRPLLTANADCDERGDRDRFCSQLLLEVGRETLYLTGENGRGILPAAQGTPWRQRLNGHYLAWAVRQIPGQALMLSFGKYVQPERGSDPFGSVKVASAVAGETWGHALFAPMRFLPGDLPDEKA